MSMPLSLKNILSSFLLASRLREKLKGLKAVFSIYTIENTSGNCERFFGLAPSPVQGLPS